MEFIHLHKGVATFEQNALVYMLWEKRVFFWYWTGIVLKKRANTMAVDILVFCILGSSVAMALIV